MPIRRTSAVQRARRYTPIPSNAPSLELAFAWTRRHSGLPRSWRQGTLRKHTLWKFSVHHDGRKGLFWVICFSGSSYVRMKGAVRLGPCSRPSMAYLTDLQDWTNTHGRVLLVTTLFVFRFIFTSLHPSLPTSSFPHSLRSPDGIQSRSLLTGILHRPCLF